jgi:long-chain alkane monooxygenase
MVTLNKEIHFNAFRNATPSQGWAGLWSHPKSNGLEYNTVEFWTDLAKQAERGLLDGIFIADVLGLSEVYGGKPDAIIRAATMFPTIDPMMPISAMAAVTKHLCFGVTGNTTYEPPYMLARRFSSLDHLTRGRLAWNIVTGAVPAVARGLGLEQVPHDTRYDIADEYLDLMYQLWEGSWEDGAVLRDKGARIFADPAKLHKVYHHDRYYNCEAIHLSEPSPQRTPFIFTAGGSGRGQAFSGRHAECTFLSTNSVSKAKAISAGFRQAAVNAGRSLNSLKVFAIASIVVAPTDAEAKEIAHEIASYLDEEGMLALYSSMIGVDLSPYGLDDPIEVIKSDAIQSIAAQMKDGNEGKPLTTRDLVRFDGKGPREAFIVGSPSTVADKLIEWSQEANIDGFNLARTVEPGGLESFIDLVVPELQERGSYKTSYREGTMREKMFPEGGSRLPAEHPGAKYRTSR